MRLKRNQGLETVLRYYWERSVIHRDSACTQNERNYYQGCIDTCNEMLCNLGFSRLDQSDEIMVVQQNKTADRISMILSDKWEKIPDSVYNS